MTTTTTKPAAAGMKLSEHAEARRIVEEFVHEHSDEILAGGGVLPDAIAELLELADEGFNAKAERTALVIRDMKGNAARAEAERDYYAQRATMWGNAAKGVSAYLQRCMGEAGVEKLKTALVTVWVQANPPAVRHEYSNEQLVAIADGEERHAAVDLADAVDEPELPHPLARFVTVERVAKLDSRALLAAYEARRAELEAEAAEILLDDADLAEVRERLADTLGPVEMDENYRTAQGDTERQVAGDELAAEMLADKRRAHVEDALAAEFPGVTVVRGQHIRQR